MTIMTCSRCGFVDEVTKSGAKKRKYEMCASCKLTEPRSQWEVWAA